MKRPAGEYWTTPAIVLVDGEPLACIALVVEQPDGERRAWFFATPDEADEALGVFALIGHPALEVYGTN